MSGSHDNGLEFWVVGLQLGQGHLDGTRELDDVQGVSVVRRIGKASGTCMLQLLARTVFDKLVETMPPPHTHTQTYANTKS